MSVIIIGVGNEKFKLMKELDSDKALLRNKMGEQASRDVVQFVKFKEFIAKGPENWQKRYLGRSQISLSHS